VDHRGPRRPVDLEDGARAEALQADQVAAEVEEVDQPLLEAGGGRGEAREVDESRAGVGNVLRRHPDLVGRAGRPAERTEGVERVASGQADGCAQAYLGSRSGRRQRAAESGHGPETDTFRARAEWAADPPRSESTWKAAALDSGGGGNRTARLRTRM